MKCNNEEKTKSFTIRQHMSYQFLLQNWKKKTKNQTNSAKTAQ